MPRASPGRGEARAAPRRAWAIASYSTRTGREGGSRARACRRDSDAPSPSTPWRGHRRRRYPRVWAGRSRAASTGSRGRRRRGARTRRRPRPRMKGRARQPRGYGTGGSSDAGILEQALQVLQHLRGVRVARKPQHEIAERIDQIDVVDRISGKSLGLRPGKARAFDGPEQLRTRRAAIGEHPKALDPRLLLALRGPDLTHEIQLSLAVCVAACRVERHQHPFPAQLFEGRPGQRARGDEFAVVSGTAGAPAEVPRRPGQHDGRHAGEKNGEELKARRHGGTTAL